MIGVVVGFVCVLTLIGVIWVAGAVFGMMIERRSPEPENGEETRTANVAFWFSVVAAAIAAFIVVAA